MNAESLYIMLNFATAVTMTLLGCILLGIHIQRKQEMKTLRIARLILALSYFVLAVPSYMEYFCCTKSDNWIIAVLTLSTAAFQSLLFTATLLVFILPQFITRRRTFRQAGSVVIAVALFLPTALCCRDCCPLLLMGLAAYVCQLIYYIILFRRKYAESLHKLENYYDEDERNRLKWVKFGFYAALTIGIVAAISTYLPRPLYNAFTVAYLLFYAWFVVRFHNYVADASFYLPAVTMVTEETDCTEEGTGYSTEEADNSGKEAGYSGKGTSAPGKGTGSLKQETDSYGKDTGNTGREPEERVEVPHKTDETTKEEMPMLPLQEKERQLQQTLEKWVADKGYTKKDIGTAEIAAELGTDLVSLRRYFHTYLPPDFRAWRMELRIREAQRIMKEEPELSISQVGERVGIADRSNFRCQFSKITGMLPADYKEKLREKEEPI